MTGGISMPPVEAQASTPPAQIDDWPVRSGTMRETSFLPGMMRSDELYFLLSIWPRPTDCA